MLFDLFILRFPANYFRIARTIPIFCRPEKRKAELVFICLNEIKDKQLSDIYFGIVYELKMLFT